MIGFEVEVGPVLLDPGGDVVEVVKPSRRWLGLELLGRLGRAASGSPPFNREAMSAISCGCQPADRLAHVSLSREAAADCFVVS